MDNNFDKCLAFVLKEEGGNDDDPHDHGGRTSRGITQREWDIFIKVNTDRPSDVWHASDEDIKLMYFSKYWHPYCPYLADGLDLMFFDFCVNAGPGQAMKTLQKSLGIIVDGKYGPQTDAALKAANTVELINNYHSNRESFYRGLTQYPRYGKGWSSRNARCFKESLSMAGTTLPAPKANPADIKINTIHGPAAGATVVVVGTAAAASYHSPLIFLGVLGTALVVGLTVHYLVNRKVTQ